MMLRFSSARRLISDCRAAAAAEFALVLPLLIMLLFGFVDYGRYVQDYHILNKAVRDGVRYASRQPFTSYGCVQDPPTATVSAGLAADLKAYVRTGSVDGTTPRLSYWDEDVPINITVTCENSTTGIFQYLDGGAPVVEISVGLPYPPISGMMAINRLIYVRAEGAVMGM